MTEAAAVKATYSEIKMVKTRGAGQLILEFPLEQFAEVVKQLGVPLPGKERWVAVALLDEPKTKVREMLIASEAEDAKRAAGETIPASEMERARTRSVLLAKDPEFIAWAPFVNNETQAAEYIRSHCNIFSRSEIANSSRAYLAYIDLERHFLIAVCRTAERRG